MEYALSVELRYLIYLSLIMLVFWVPYSLAELRTSGIIKTLGYPDDRQLPAWAKRWKAAHYNLVENFGPFAVAVLAGELLDVHTGITAACALIFFAARVIHPFAQMLRIWGTRTLVYAVGQTATIVYLIVILVSVTR